MALSNGQSAQRTRHRMTPSGKVAISRFPLHEQVASRLRDMIIEGDLKPGERLRFSDLSEKLEVSLTPVREALKILAEEQLVELTPNRPTRVAPITAQDTRALFEVIAGIEALAAELAASRITPDELEHLETLHSKMRNHHVGDSRAAYFALNREIHDLVAEYAGNPILTHLRSKLALRAERVRFFALREGSRRCEAMQEHEDLMNALRNRSPEDARRTWRKHLLNSGEEMCRILKLEEAETERPRPNDGLIEGEPYVPS